MAHSHPWQQRRQLSCVSFDFSWVSFLFFLCHWWRETCAYFWTRLIAPGGCFLYLFILSKWPHNNKEIIIRIVRIFFNHTSCQFALTTALLQPLVASHYTDLDLTRLLVTFSDSAIDFSQAWSTINFFFKFIVVKPGRCVAKASISGFKLLRIWCLYS